MSHHANELEKERREENRLEDIYLQKLHEDQEFLEGVYATTRDDATRQRLIAKHFCGDK